MIEKIDEFVNRLEATPTENSGSGPCNCTCPCSLTTTEWTTKDMNKTGWMLM